MNRLEEQLWKEVGKHWVRSSVICCFVLNTVSTLHKDIDSYKTEKKFKIVKRPYILVPWEAEIYLSI